MPRKTVVVTSSPSIMVIQGAYETLRDPAGTIAECQPVTNWTLVPQSSVRIALSTEPPVDDWLKFQTLVSEWRHERGVASSITEAALCPAYQHIIGMGLTAVPFILWQLESEGADPDQWFWALKAVTGADPVRDADRGNFAKMAESWLEWARTEGYAW